jgi:hypothetical protein
MSGRRYPNSIPLKILHGTEAKRTGEYRKQNEILLRKKLLDKRGKQPVFFFFFFFGGGGEGGKGGGGVGRVCAPFSKKKRIVTSRKVGEMIMPDIQHEWASCFETRP